MKRVLMVFVFVTGSLHAQDLSDTWTQLSQYRVVSGVKAGVTGIGAVHMLIGSYVAARSTADVLRAGKSFFAYNKDAWNNWNELIGGCAATFGLLYAGSKLGWEYFPGYVRHALAIK